MSATPNSYRISSSLDVTPCLYAQPRSRVLRLLSIRACKEEPQAGSPIAPRPGPFVVYRSNFDGHFYLRFCLFRPHPFRRHGPGRPRTDPGRDIRRPGHDDKARDDLVQDDLARDDLVQLR